VPGPQVRRRPAALVAAASVLLLAAACGADPAEPDATGPTSGPPATSDGTLAVAEPTTAAEGSPTGAPDGEATTAAAEPASVPPQPSADELAGLLSREVPQTGSGATVVVPGSTPAPPARRQHRVRVEVEGGVPVDGAAFAGFVLETLNDPRGWGAEGDSFGRTDGAADLVLVLASPDTSAALCRPLVTRGTLSCRNGDRVILTHHRWVTGTEDYGDDLTGYRRYLVNHEVGHYLGHGHVGCPGAGRPAPVMQQQTKGVKPCVPNSWPYP